MSRTRLNLAVDALAFATFVLLTSTGVLMRWVLPPGSGHRTTVLGLDRHDWGGVHFWISMLFLGSLAVHVLVHWRWIATVVRGHPREGSGIRVALGIVGLLAVLAAAAAPFFAGVEVEPRGGGRHRDAGAQEAPAAP